MPHKKPSGLLSKREKPSRLCPVCGSVSYSLGGVHPQCAQQQADAVRMQRVKLAKKSVQASAKPANPSALKPWHKLCPKCRVQVHIRKAACECGHKFGKIG